MVGAEITMDRFAEMMLEQFNRIDQRFEQIDQRFEQIDQRFEKVENRLDQMATKKDLQKLENKLDRIYIQHDSRISTLEEKVITIKNTIKKEAGVAIVW